MTRKHDCCRDRHTHRTRNGRHLRDCGRVRVRIEYRERPGVYISRDMVRKLKRAAAEAERARSYGQLANLVRRALKLKP